MEYISTYLNIRARSIGCASALLLLILGSSSVADELDLPHTFDNTSWSAGAGRVIEHDNNPQFKFELTSAKNLEITLENKSSRCITDPYLYLLDENDKIITKNDDKPSNPLVGCKWDSKITQQLGIGKYTLVAATYYNNFYNKGDFKLRIREVRNRVCNDQWNPSAGQTYTSPQNPRKTLRLQQLGNITIDLESEADTYLYLLDPSGNVIKSNDDGGYHTNSRISFNLMGFLYKTGDYSLVAGTYYDNEQKDFTLSVAFDEEDQSSELICESPTNSASNQPISNTPIAQANFEAGADISKTYANLPFSQIASGGSGNGAITYRSSNTAIATVNASSGRVTINDVGTTRITASKAADSNYLPAEDSYQLIVRKTQQVIGFGPSGSADRHQVEHNYAANYSLDSPEVHSYSFPGGDGIVYRSSSSAVTYSSGDENIASVDPSTGRVTIKGAGTTQINAIKAADNNYLEARASYTLNVKKAPQKIEVVPRMIGNNEFKLQEIGSVGTGNLSYHSSDESIVTVDSAGKMTYKSVSGGSATITITKAADANYIEGIKKIEGFFTATRPQAPSVSFDYKTKSWVWRSGTGHGPKGIGKYRYQINSESDNGWSDEVDANYFPITVDAAGFYSLYVQERDAVGIWSKSKASKVLIPKITVLDRKGDIIAPGSTTKQHRFTVKVDSGVEKNSRASWKYTINKLDVENAKAVTLSDKDVTNRIQTKEYLVTNVGQPVEIKLSEFSYQFNVHKDTLLSHIVPKITITDLNGNEIKPNSTTKESTVWVQFNAGVTPKNLSWSDISSSSKNLELYDHYVYFNDKITKFKVSAQDNGPVTLKIKKDTYKDEDDYYGPENIATSFTWYYNFSEELEAQEQKIDLRLMPDRDKSTVKGTLSTVNVYNNNLTYSIETAPTLGTLELDSGNGNFTYKLSPANNSLSESKSDWFSFKVRDAKNRKESTAIVDINFKNDPFYDHQWHTSQSNASILLHDYPRKGEISRTNGLSPNLNLHSVINNGYTGKGVIVAIIDDGLALDHSDLKDNLVAGGSWDFVDNDDNPDFNSNSEKVGNHGTTVAAILGAVGWNNIGFRGVAPGVSLKGFRILNNGSLNLNHEYLAAGKHEKAKDVDIFNMSYGTSVTNIKNLGPGREKGFWVNANRNNARKVFIRAAGNGFKSFDTSNGKKECPLASSYNLPCGTTTMDPIADHPVIINVAAIAPDGKADENSNQGAANWISAPHGSYVSSEDCWHLADCKTARYTWGTSWAAPMVSGVVALMLETNPNLTWRDVKYILAKTAVQIDHGNQQKRPSIIIKGVNVEQGWTTNAAEFTFHNAYGFGLVDTKDAVELAKVYRSDNLGDFVKYDGLTSSTLDMSIHPNNLYESTINQSISGIIEAVKVKIYIESEHISDLSFALVSPSETRSVILSPFNAIESIEDGYFELSSNAFYGETMQGEWKIEVYDHLIDSTKQDRSDTSNNVTRLNSWSLKLYGHDKN